MGKIFINNSAMEVYNMGKIIQTAGKNALGEFAPEFAHFNDDVLFGENWNNQLCTVSFGQKFSCTDFYFSGWNFQCDIRTRMS